MKIGSVQTYRTVGYGNAPIIRLHLGKNRRQVMQAGDSMNKGFAYPLHICLLEKHVANTLGNRQHLA